LLGEQKERIALLDRGDVGGELKKADSGDGRKRADAA